VFCRSMTSDSASGKEELESCGWYMFDCLRNLGLVIVEMKRPSGACSSTESGKVGWAMISNVHVVTASRSGLIGWVV